VPSHHRCLAVCPPGIEEICAAELSGLGVRIRRTFRGGVEFGASDRQLYAANLWSRTTTRIVERVAAFTASTFADLERGLAAVAWDRWIPAGATPAVRVSSTASRLYHTGAVAERVAAAIGTGPGEAPLVVLRLVHDRVMVSVDSSGEPLHRRGWRRQTAKAPLRETLAAAMILASGWDATSPLVDPLCGSGTIAVEAALLATGRPPGEGRRFAFEDWPSFAPGTWASVSGGERTVAGDVPAIVASDRDAGAVEAAAGNAERAGVSALVQIGQRPLADVRPPPGGPGWVLTNPPYGKRVGGADLRALYAQLGSVVAARFEGWTTGILAADRRLAGHTGLDLSEVLRTDNGGIPVRFLLGPLRSNGDGHLDRHPVGQRRAPG
jgi:putative N6-adenine-specific DNA methylase